MTSRAHELLQEALALPVNERADVAAELLASLDGATATSDPDFEAAGLMRSRGVLAGSWPTETLIIPAHIENGSVQLDAPLPAGIISVELRVQLADTGKPRRSLAEYVRSLPPGTRTAEEIDRQFREGRADRL